MSYLDKAGIEYAVVDANEHAEEARANGVLQAPTLIAGGELYAGAGAIRRYVQAASETA